MIFKQKWTGTGYDSSAGKMYGPFDANVPGNIQRDYADFACFSDFSFSDNVKRFEEIEDFDWFYTAKLEYERKPGEILWFVAGGIDYSYDISLDGKEIYSGEGMFTPAEIDIGSVSRPGSELRIHIRPHPKREGAAPCRDQADQSCKPPFCYGWDWNPRLLVSGLWKDAYIETRGAGYIRSCEPRYTLGEKLDTAYLRFETDCDLPVRYTLRDADGKVLYSGYENTAVLRDIRLWWCAGEGEPYLYSWEADSGNHKLSGTLGFRKVKLVHNEGADNVAGFPKSRYPTCATVELNGRRIFAKGTNWVNPELFPGTVTKERYETLLGLAADAGMNIIRVWGGSGVNKPEFYDLCDEKGIMVWQEFMLACNNYRGTPEYLAVLEREARSIIRSLRGHPSLILWCGGNELFNSWSGMDDQSHALRLLNKLCYEEDFERPFLATSPLYGMAHGGYSFADLNDGRDVFELFCAADNVAYTEFGVPSMAPAEQLKKIIPEDELFPVSKTSSWICHHGFGAWVGDSHIHPAQLEYYFGKADSLEELVEQSGKLQYAGLRSIFEEARRQWPHCSMAINWCFDEPWPAAANLSVIAYPDIKKPGYYAIKEALRPVLVCARIPRYAWHAGETFSAEIWMLNSSNESISETVEAYAEIDGVRFGTLTWDTGEIPARTNRSGPVLRFSLPRGSNSDKILLILNTKDRSRSGRYELVFRSCSPGKAKKSLNN